MDNSIAITEEAMRLAAAFIYANAVLDSTESSPMESQLSVTTGILCVENVKVNPQKTKPTAIKAADLLGIDLKRIFQLGESFHDTDELEAARYI